MIYCSTLTTCILDYMQEQLENGAILDAEVITTAILDLQDGTFETEYDNDF